MQLSPRERDLLIRTIIGEARGQGELGMGAVAHVINNRVQSGRYGTGYEGVIMRPKQFEPWTTRRDELMGYTPKTPGWSDAESVLAKIERGELPDPTKGATHFANVATVRERGDPAGRPGGWLSTMTNQTQIGAHTFGNADAGSIGSGRRALGTYAQKGPTPVQPMLAQGGEQGPPIPAGYVAPDPTKNAMQQHGVVGALSQMANSTEGITMGGIKSFLGEGGGAAGIASGIAGVASALNPPKAAAPAPPPMVIEPENRGDMSLLAMIGKKRRKKLGVA